MDKAISFRVIYDDGSTLSWGDTITVNGVEKEASFDDIDQDKAGQLVTIDALGKVLHSLTRNQTERADNKFIWRCFSGMNHAGDKFTIGALAGFNDRIKGVVLDIVAPDGGIYSGAGQDIQLHVGEVFTEKEVEGINSYVNAQESVRVMDNELLANPVIKEPVSTKILQSLAN